MKVLTASEIRSADLFTIEHEPISSIDLMERAAKACTDWLSTNFDTSCRFLVFCGTGNNGGDGLAIARLLLKKKYKVITAIIRYANSGSDDFFKNETRLQKIKGALIHHITEKNKNELLKTLFIFRHSPFAIHHSPFTIHHPPTTIHHSPVIIDALFGTGLNKPVTGIYSDVIQAINQSGFPVISIDIPSGLFCEENAGNDRKSIIKADHTLTFQTPKIALFLPENGDFTGDFSILNIGLNENFISRQLSANYFLTSAYVSSLLRKRKKFSHKGNFGHGLLIAGSYGMMGAAVLAAKACLRCGAGLLTVHSPRCGFSILQTAVPEAIYEADSSENFISGNLVTEKFNAVAVGPGIGKAETVVNSLKAIIQNCRAPLVFDADAINIISENKTWLSFIPRGTIFTPHPKEFERLAGVWNNDFDRLQKQIAFSKKYGFYIVLKGAHTSISCPDGSVYFNSTGNCGMATAGSGDVLTGMITSFLAQGYSTCESCILGVYMHGLAGDIAAEKLSEESLLAGDIVQAIGKAFKKLKKFSSF